MISMNQAAIKSKLKYRAEIKDLVHWFVCHFRAKPKLRKQFRANNVNAYGPRNPKPKRILVTMVETSHYQFLHVLGIAKALQLRGHDIKVLLCDESLPGCELKSVTNESKKDVCWMCRFNRKELVPIFGLESITYSDIFSGPELDQLKKDAKTFASSSVGESLDNLSGLAQCIKDSVVRYFYGDVPKDLEVVGRVTLAHTQTALINHSASKRIDDLWRPDIVFANMTAYSTWYPIFLHYQDRMRTISMSDFNFFGMTFNFHEYFQSNSRYLEFKNSRSERYLTELERERIEGFFNDRVEGKDRLFLRDDCFSDDPERADLAAVLRIDPTKRKLFLFSNLYWDIGLSEPGALYSGVVDWVLDTIRLLKDNTDIQLFIKTHPAELYGPAQSRKGMPEIIRESFTEEELANVFIIGPELKLKPYALFAFIDCAILFQGTLGFELLYSDVPVVSCSRGVYSDLDFVHEPKTREEYRAMLESAGQKHFNRDEFYLLAYFYFIKAVIPWRISKTVYASSIANSFNISNLEALSQGKDRYLDHLCDCIVSPESTVPESWVETGVTNLLAAEV